MELKINREIRDYTEAVFFGMSLKQLGFAACAAASAVGAYFAFSGTLGTEAVSWICMAAAAPFAALGFLKVSGMSAGKFLKTWIRARFLEPRVFPCSHCTLYTGSGGADVETKKKKGKGKKSR